MKIWNKEINRCGHCGLCTLEFKVKDNEIEYIIEQVNKY